MIIDVHTRVWLSVDQLGVEVAKRLRDEQAERWGHLDASPPAHEQAMGCVDGSIVLGYRSDRARANVPNEYVAEYVGRDPRRRIGVAGIDPMSDDAMDQMDIAVGLGLSGVSVSPACQGFHPAHSSAMRVYERCLAETMPLFVVNPVPLSASSDLEFARPGLWDEVARTFPELPIVISRLGHPWVDEALVVLGKHANVWADIAGVCTRPWQLYGALLNAASFGVMDKLLFGSGFPHDTPTKAIESVYSVNTISSGTQMPNVPRSQIRGIVERDAITCLGLDTVITPRPTAGDPVDLEPSVRAVSHVGDPTGSAS